MPRPEYHEIPPEAPNPRIWKSLGQVLPGLMANYAVSTLNDALDPDSEDALRQEIAGITTVMRSISDGARLVRYARGSMPELLIQFLVLGEDDWAALNTPAKRRN